MPVLQFLLNDRTIRTDAPAGMPALDFVRQHGNLKGTKEGCREGECGACTVLVGGLRDRHLCYRAVASCLIPLGELAGKHVLTIDGLTDPVLGDRLPDDGLTPQQQALYQTFGAQCGFLSASTPSAQRADLIARFRDEPDGLLPR